MAKKINKKSASDALKLMDSRYGVSSDEEILHEQFTEQAKVAEALFAARTAAGLSQTELAKLAGTSLQVISQLEDADYQGNWLNMLPRIATAMDSHVDVRIIPNQTDQLVN